MKLKSKIISSAVVAALGSIAGTAQAVNLGADGQGQVLLYPYYTVNSKGTTAFDTYISIVNSDTVRGKAVKVRFLEGKNSKEVLDFNLYLSPNDVWVGGITRDASGNGLLKTGDVSCTAPQIPAAGQPFVNYAYAADLAVDAALSRTREGYIEVIQMADIDSPVASGGTNLTPTTYTRTKHVNSVPPGCAALATDWEDGAYSEVLLAPTGGLSGTGTVINPLEGTDISYNAVAIDNFSAVALHFNPGNVQPALADVNPKISRVLTGTDVLETNWTAAIGGAAPNNLPGSIPVSAVILREQIVNEYAVAAAPVGLGTDWVITFPTKTDHVNAATLAAVPLPFVTRMSATGACEAVSVTAYNREEAVTTSGLQFSPTSAATGNSLCWEANVLSINTTAVTSNVLGGVLTRKALTVPYTEGYLNLRFAQTVGAGTLATTTRAALGAAPGAPYTAVYTGLPVLGFSAMTFVNTSSLANYGGSYDHRYIRKIAP